MRGCGPGPWAGRPRAQTILKAEVVQAMLHLYNLYVVTRFGVLASLPTRLDTPLMPRRRVCSRSCGSLGAVRRLSGCPSPAHRRSDQPRSASTRSGAVHVADRSARGQHAIASSPERADRLRDPRHRRVERWRAHP